MWGGVLNDTRTTLLRGLRKARPALFLVSPSLSAAVILGPDLESLLSGTTEELQPPRPT